MKKFIISSDRLKPVLNKLGQAVMKNTALPVLKNILCKISDKQVEFISSDLEVTIKCRCEAETSETFDMLIPFEFLKKVVALTRSTPLSIELKGKKGFITGENDVYEMGALDPATDFPKIPELPKKNSIQVTEDFISWINKGLIAVAKDGLRPSMCHILLEVASGGITMVATDAHILFKKFFSIPSTVEEQLLISPKVAGAINGISEMNISWQKTHIGFNSKDITVIATRATEKFPDYKVVIPASDKNLSLNRSQLISALEKCALAGGALKQTSVFLKEKNEILFEAEDLDLERKIDVRIPGDFTGNIEKVTISAEKLLSLLSQVAGDQISLAIQTASLGILLTDESDPDYLGLIMPITS